MDPKLAKGLAKEFLRRVQKMSIQRHDEIVNTIKTRGNSLSKFFEKIKSTLNTENNNFAIHRAEFGSKSKAAIGLTVLTQGHYNHGLDRDEDMIYGQQLFLFRKPPDFIQSDLIQFSISKHLIQRLIERHPDISSFDYDLIFDIVKNELTYVTIYSSVIDVFLTFAQQNASIPNKVFNSEKPLIFPIPSENGMFISHVNQRLPSLRTFKSLNEMNEEEIALRTKMIELTEPYCFNNFPYIYEDARKYKPVSTTELKFHLAMAFFAIIFVDFREVFKLIIPNAFQDMLPEGQKKEVIQKLMVFLEEFPQGKTPEIMEFNANFRQAIKNKKSVDHFRKVSLEITRAFHNSKPS